MDSFVLEAVSLKNIRKIRIGHDGTGECRRTARIGNASRFLLRSGPGAGWYLHKVEVRPDDKRYAPVTFVCDR